MGGGAPYPPGYLQVLRQHRNTEQLQAERTVRLGTPCCRKEASPGQSWSYPQFPPKNENGRGSLTSAESQIGSGPVAVRQTSHDAPRSFL